MSNKLLETFQALNDVRVDNFHLHGDLCFVAVLDQEIVTESGIVIETVKSHVQRGFGADMPTICEILLVGEGFYDDDEKHVAVEAKPGDIVLVGANSIKLMSALGGASLKVGSSEVGMIQASEIQLRFFGESAYAKCSEILKRGLQ